MNEARLRIRQLQTAHLRIEALDVQAGECVAISGSSGTGKSLLLRAIADLDPHEGECWLDGQAASAMPAPQWRRRVAYLAADNAWWYPTVEQHFETCPEPTTLTAIGLDTSLLLRPVEKLSSGERQRLALLRLLVSRPAVLLLDEPTASLDPDSTIQLESCIHEYRQDCDTAVIWVSHDPAQIHRIAARHYRLANGCLQEVIS